MQMQRATTIERTLGASIYRTVQGAGTQIRLRS
jgi:hypothetical protein